MIAGLSLTALLFILPILVAVIATIGFIKWRNRWLRGVSAALAALSLAATLYLAWEATPYFYACYLESQWRAGKPKTQEELESYLSLYREQEIDISQSLWGKHHELQEGERMVQYLIMWREPLDVVYNSSNQIVRIFTSYE
jgi:hypothetical protein